MMQQASILGRRRALIPLAFILPFLLGASLYLSVVFAIFCSVPIVFAHMRLGRLLGILCAFTNLALVWLISGQVNAALFFVLGPVLGVTIAECFKLRLRVEWNVAYSVFMMALVSSVLVFSYSQKFHVNPVEKLDEFVGSVVDKVATDIQTYKATGKVSNQDLDRFLVDPQLTKKNILAELPSFIGICFLILSISNLLLLLRVNVLKIRDKLGLSADFFKSWKAPEKIVWPTIAAGFCLVIEIPWISVFALNIFKILMAIYAVQGLAILSYLFDAWDIRGFLRPAGYVIAVAVLLPLVISLGFFDLWFGFREKLKK